MNIYSQYPELDSVNIPLNGVSVIEAAAGTGKTYNIQNLVARMIVELEYPIDKIVVVTFTELAAKELSERLHAVLEMLYTVLLGQCCAAENDQVRAEKLIAAFDEKNISRSDQLERIRSALQDFDNCRVSTIHGFCARVLSENAFESSVAFKVRMETNIKQYVSKLLDDYCRSKRYGSSRLPGDAMLESKDFISNVNLLLDHPDMSLEIKVPVFDNEELLADAIDALTDEVLAMTDAAKIISNIPGKLKKIDNMSSGEFISYCAEKLRELQQARGAASPREWLDLMDKLVRAAQKGNIFKADAENVTAYMQSQRLFAIAEEYCGLLYKSLPLLRTMEAVKFVRERLARWKEQDNFQSFDDLLITVHDALKNDTLCKVLQKKFYAGIIDEFQDTDPLQYAIFKRIFMERDQATSFFMVGDPRQAIYSFRGGDLATYMTARKECVARADGHIYKLSCNYRSSGAMIDSFNELFRHGDFFAAADLRAEMVMKPEDVKIGMCKDGVEMPDPLQVSFLPDSTKDDLLRQCACDILNLLNDRSYQLMDKDGLRRVRPGDIAVLTFDKKELNAIRALLVKHNVPVICEYKNGIWGSAEASELAVFLNAVLENGQDPLLREALLGRLCGISGKKISASMDEQQEVMQNWRSVFADLGAIWRRNGIAAMLAKAFAVKWDGVSVFKSRTAAVRGGERCITNFMQLGDLLAAAERNEHLSPRGVINYLNYRIDRSQDFDSDESAEMMESDRTAVKLMTIHSSKGLQFPVVFLPDMSRRYPFKYKGMKSFHRDGKLCCNPDCTDHDAAMLAMAEEMQELMRLVYVAVTRACSACFMTWGKNNFAGSKSAMDWLFRMQNTSYGDLELLNSFLTKLPELPAVSISGALQRHDLLDDAEFADYCGEFSEAVLAEPPQIGEVFNRWRLLSYSALDLDGSGNKKADEFTDYDDCDDEEAFDKYADLPQLTGGIWDIPGGAAIGNAWHKILEVIDFQQPIQRREVEKIMQFYNFDAPTYIDGTCMMLEKLMHCPLACNVSEPDGEVFTLSDISRSQRINEFEFLLSSPDGVNMQKVLAAVEPYLLDEFRGDYSSSVQEVMEGGFFTGFIDLFFEHNNRLYIVDWKSNTLGRRRESFFGDALKQAMFEATYPMQYLCYTAAAVRYLEHRLNRVMDEELYAERFGGVYYIFLRGMTFDKTGGIFSARPPLETVLALLDALGCRKDSWL